VGLKEVGGAGERAVAFVQDGGEGLEYVWDVRSDVEGDGDVVCCCSCCEGGGVIE
jgi:hypothetical protein